MNLRINSLAIHDETGMCQILQNRVTLEKGETRELRYAFGHAGTVEKVKRVKSIIDDARKVESLREECRAAEAKLDSASSIETGDTRIDYYINH